MLSPGSIIESRLLQLTMQTTMQNTSNAGVRLHRILEKGASLPGNMAVLKAWASLFDIDKPFDVELAVDVAERLVWLNQDLKHLRDSGHPDEGMEPVLRHLEQALSPVYLSSNWEVVKQFLSSDGLRAFKEWAEALPETETAIDRDELSAIQAQAQELEADLNSSVVPEDFRPLMAEQIRSIQKAVSRYPLNGRRALQEAAFTAYGELAGAGDMLMRHCDIPEIATLVKLWRKVSLLTDKAAGKENIVRLQGDPWSHFCPDSP